ncbi:MAG: UDP-N-acetylmuramate--L-alanine ligase [Lentisphaeria bacterium]|jgi:UDP-N-acetylmuramate--alanine ligase
MSDQSHKHIHFTGVGGVGMAGLAHICADLGCSVSGSDVADSAMLASLRRRGLDVLVGHDNKLVGQAELLVYSSAVPEDDPERQEAAKRGIASMRRGEFLGELARAFPRTVAVAGSHGKTSVTAMLAHICRQAGMAPGYLVGGLVNGWERAAGAGRGELLLAEVDESDGTQVFFHADIAVILNIDDDHCWSHGGVEALERCFVDFARQARRVVAWRSDNCVRLLGSLEQVMFVDEPLALSSPIPLALSGRHNRVNGAMAVAVAELLGVPAAQARRALLSYPGVQRRLSERYRRADGRLVVLEDYAHHPAELRATLDALGEAYPGYRRLLLFQPHRYERVKRYAADFAAILAEVEQAWVLAPFAAWRHDEEIAEPETIVRLAREISPGSAVAYLPNDPPRVVATLLAALSACPAETPQLLALIGAGDISAVWPVLRAALDA